LKTLRLSSEQVDERRCSNCQALATCGCRHDRDWLIKAPPAPRGTPAFLAGRLPLHSGRPTSAARGLLWAMNRWPEVRDRAICPISGIGIGTGTTSPKPISPRPSPADPLSRRCLYIHCVSCHSCSQPLETPRLTSPSPPDGTVRDPSEHPISHLDLNSQTSSHTTAMVRPLCLPSYQSAAD
jgi:hypothetical protein